MYIHRCVSAREGILPPGVRRREIETAIRRRETFVDGDVLPRRAAFDDRLTAADVGLALRDAAELFEMDDAETGSAKWFEEVGAVREFRASEVRNEDGTRALADLAVLAASRGFYSLGSSMHWHATCAHAGAVLHAALFARAEGDALVWAEPGYAQGTPDLLLAAADLEERCRGTVHASSLARRAASILASTSARIRERRRPRGDFGDFGDFGDCGKTAPPARTQTETARAVPRDERRTGNDFTSSCRCSFSI